jgi:medium-chain acyl-[acyl-carrier-protein] hydrolase
MTASPWLSVWRSGDGPASVRLFCFPPAGGGASFFRDWADALPADVEVSAIQLPGRETRLRESPHARMGPLVDDLSATLRPHLDRPFAIFGHSMGALVGFELARRLHAASAPEPALVVVAGQRAPHLPLGRELWHRLPTPRLLDALRELNGIPELVLDNAELRELVLPAIRADLELC